VTKKNDKKSIILNVLLCHSDPERSEGEESHPFFFFLFKACN